MESKWTPHDSEFHPQLLTIPLDKTCQGFLDVGKSFSLVFAIADGCRKTGRKDRDLITVDFIQAEHDFYSEAIL